jgi:hypothetical protein
VNRYGLHVSTNGAVENRCTKGGVLTRRLLSMPMIFLLVCAPAFAHHGTAAYESKAVTLKGTVTNFQFINPHVLLSFNVVDSSGRVQAWEGEITSPSQLARNGGWTKESLKPGDQITISGNPAKNGSFTMRVLKVFLKGEELKIGEN